MVNTKFIHDFISTHIHDNLGLPLSKQEYKIYPSGLVDLESSYSKLVAPPTSGMLPFPLHTVRGDFNLGGMVKSLKNMPNEVIGDFDCSYCGLDTLEHAPQMVHGNFICNHNNLSSLQYASDSLSGVFFCNQNRLEDLSSAPPCEELWVLANPIKTLEHVPDHVEKVHVTWKPQLPLLKLVLIQTTVVFHDEHYKTMPELNQIVDKYKGQGKRLMLHFALDLKKAGFEGNAVW